jgi:hypothetical protein
MSLILTCPGTDTLNVLCSSDGDHSCDPDLAVHVEHCADCQQALERLARNGFPTGTGTRASDQMPARGELPEFEGFVVARELDRGGMGVVYLARQLVPGREVAIKCVARGPLGTLKERRRWLREAEMASNVRHPNVVTVYGVLEAADSLLLILEYIPGGSLARRLAGPLAPRDAAGLVEKIARAVHHIHLNNLLHLDLKPSNILLDSSSGDGTSWDALVPKISDFGIAIRTDRSTTGSDSGHLGGTPVYMAPEQVSGSAEQLGPAVDIHALGAILYEMLTGRPPFQGASAIETLDQVRTQEPVPVRRLTPGVPRDLETITLKCLQKSPQHRYATADAVGDDLRRFLDSRPIQARPISAVERGWRWCRRRPLFAGTLATIIPALFITFGIVHMFWAQAEAERARAGFARESAARNLRIASLAIGHLERVIQASIDGSPPLERDELDRTVALLQQTAMTPEVVRALTRPELIELSGLHSVFVGRLRAAGRRSEARGITRDRIALLQEYRQKDPDSEELLLEAGFTMLQSATFELNDGRIGEALHYVNESSSLAQHTPIAKDFQPAHQADWSRGYLASLVSDFYSRLSKRFAGTGGQLVLPEAQLSRRKLLEVMEKFDPSRPDVILFKSCILADLDEWELAREPIETQLLTKRSTVAAPVRLQGFTKHAVAEWTMREAGHSAAALEHDAVEGESIRRHAEVVVDHVARLIGNLETRQGADPPMKRLCNELTTRAADCRRTGHLAAAENITKFLMEIAKLVVVRFPDSAESYLTLSQAYVQQSKNAWKKNDIGAVRQGLTQSIAELNRALALAPGDGTIRSCLHNETQRLANLPK